MLRIGIKLLCRQTLPAAGKTGNRKSGTSYTSVRYYLTDSVRRKRSFISNKLKTGLKNYGGIRGSVSAKHNRQSVIIPGLSQSRGTDSYQVVIFNISIMRLSRHRWQWFEIDVINKNTGEFFNCTSSTLRHYLQTDTMFLSINKEDICPVSSRRFVA
ncbi:Uncharacterised protein [Escherichia coli]|uniref:Uncharacterized protein n=1 Tax=Escherichia coli TaxID=562 RepID=A0A376MP74_ECOLX|nr:Uncharacterised protein [Escherichia coli]